MTLIIKLLGKETVQLMMHNAYPGRRFPSPTRSPSPSKYFGNNGPTEKERYFDGLLEVLTTPTKQKILSSPKPSPPTKISPKKYSPTMIHHGSPSKVIDETVSVERNLLASLNLSST